MLKGLRRWSIINDQKTTVSTLAALETTEAEFVGESGSIYRATTPFDDIEKGAAYRANSHREQLRDLHLDAHIRTSLHGASQVVGHRHTRLEGEGVGAIDQEHTAKSGGGLLGICEIGGLSEFLDKDAIIAITGDAISIPEACGGEIEIYRDGRNHIIIDRIATIEEQSGHDRHRERTA